VGKESFEIATKIAYRNGGQIRIPRDGNMDYTMVAAAPVLPVGYVAACSTSLTRTENYSLGTSSVVPAWRRWVLRMPFIWRIRSTEAP
jgi:hypothetical protein